MKKIIDGKQDVDITVKCWCGSCHHKWQENYDYSKIVLPSGVYVKEMGYISICPKCGKKDVLTVDEESTKILLANTPTECLPF